MVFKKSWEKSWKNFFPRFELLPQALFFFRNSVSLGKRPFPSVSAIAAGAFFCKKITFFEKTFSKKMSFFEKKVIFWFHKDISKSYRDHFTTFLPLLANPQWNIWFRHVFQKITKKTSNNDKFARFPFSTNRIFRLGILTDFEKNVKKLLIFDARAHDVTISAFFCVLYIYIYIILIGENLDERFFIGKNDPFSNFCKYLTNPPRRHCNFIKKMI